MTLEPMALLAALQGSRPRLGLVYTPDRPIGGLVDSARDAEQLGFDEFWLVEDCFRYGGLTAAAVALSGTARITVGVGLLPAVLRNPAVVAMELGTLATLYPSRIQAAFGHGVDSWMRQVGARPPDRVAALAEVLEAVGALLRGDRVTRRGRFVTLDQVQLASPPAHPPSLLVGTTGPRGVELARRSADGLLLPEGSGETAVRAIGAGQPTTVYAWLRVERDREAALGAVLPAVAAWHDWGLYPRLAALAGLADSRSPATSDVGALAVAGTPGDCASTIRALAAAGAASIALIPVGAEPAQQLRAFASEVMPLL